MTVCATALLLVGQARAATFGWSGFGSGAGSGAGTAWLTAGNWTNNAGTPGVADIAWFGAAGTVSTIGFNLNGAPLNSTNIGVITLGAGSTIDRVIGNSATSASAISNFWLHGISGGLITNSVAARTLTIAPFTAGGSTVPLALRLPNAGTIEAVGNVNIISVIVGTANISKTGAGVLTLSTNNSFTGKMIVNAGVLAISNEDRLGPNPGASSADTITLNGGTLRNTAAVTIDDANRGITLGTGGGYFDPSGGTMTISRPIVGSGNLHKINNGNAISLNVVNNTYSGKTLVTNGTINIINDGSLGAVPGAYVADHLTLDGAILFNNNSSYAIPANRGIFINNSVQFGVGWLRSCDIYSIVSGPGTMTIRSDVTPGALRLHSASTFTNHVIIGNSTAGNSWAILEINGSLASSVGGRVFITTNGFLTGNGVINRAVQGTNGAVINAGIYGLPGTLTINGSLSLTSAVVSADLATLTTVGGGVNDLLQVNGNLNLAGLVTVKPAALSGTLATGTYRLINYTGTLTGGAANLVADAPGYTISFDTSTPGEINMIVSAGTPVTAIWRGNNGSPTAPPWDVNITTNWTVGGNPDVFRQGYNALFDNTGTYLLGNGGLVPITLFGPSVDGNSLLPANVTVDTTNNVTVTSSGTSSGKLSGPTAVVKKGSGVLNMATGNNNFPSDYTGPTIVEGGILRATYERSFGATNGPTIATNGGTLDVNNVSLGAEPFVASGAGVSNNGAIVNLTGGQNNALRYLTLAGDATVGGTARWDVRNYAQNNGWPAAFVNGNGFSLVKTGANQVSFVDVGNVNLGKVTVQQGNLQLEGNTTITNNSFDVEVDSGATLGLWGSARFHTKPLSLDHNSRIFKDNGTTTNDGPVALNGGTAIIEIANNGGDILQFRNVLSGAGGLAKIGAGNFVLSGTNTYTGPTVVSNGTLTIQGNGAIASSALVDVKAGAVLNVNTMNSTFTLGSAQTLSGSGSVLGRVTADTGSTVAPGTSPGTLSVSSNLVLNNASLVFELNTANTEGGGVNDLINSRDLTLSGMSSVNIIPLTPLGAGPYTLMRYTNTLTGGAPNLNVGGSSRYTWTVDTTAPFVRITPSGTPASLVWGGGVSGSETVWDVKITDNWTNAGVQDFFFQGDAVAFDDLAAYTNITLVGSLSPGNITANHTVPYAWGGSGQIKTLNQFAKQGTGTLVIGNDNPELNGGITISGGTLQIGAGGAAGSVGPSAPITNNSVLAFSRSDSNGLPNVIRGTGGLVKNGAGILAVAGGNAFSGPVVVNDGTLRLANVNALGANNNSVTVNDGGAVDLGGQSQTAANQRYSYTIAGSGPDGRGALVNKANSVSGNSGVSNLTLTADAVIAGYGTDGDGGRFDIGGTGWGLLDGGGNRLIKLGAGRIPIRTTNTINLAELVISNGMIYAESFDNNIGTNVTVYSGGAIGMYSPAGVRRTNNAIITLEGGALTGGGQTADVSSNYWTSPIIINQPSTFHAGLLNPAAHHVLANNLIGSSLISVIPNNNRRFDFLVDNDGTFSGPWSINSGSILRTVESGTLGSGAITNLGLIEWFNLNTYSLPGVVSAPFGQGTFRVAPGAGALTLADSFAQNFLSAQNANFTKPVTFGSGFNGQLGTLSVGVTNVFGAVGSPAFGHGKVNIDAGATLNVGSFFLGDQNSQTGAVYQAGGNVTVTNQFRVAHYPNAVSTYTMDDGTLTMTLNSAANPSGAGEQNGGFYVGIDGVGVFTQNGGSVTTPNLVMDNRGSSVLGLETNTYNLNGGTLTIGRWGIQSPVSTYQINLGNGTLAASANWTSVLRMTLTGTPTVDPGTNNITLVGPISGSGGMTKEGAGTLWLHATNTFTGGDIIVNNGTLSGTGMVSSTVTVNENGTFAPGPTLGIFTQTAGNYENAGTTLMKVSRSGATFTNDTIRVQAGNFSVTGPLVVTNVGGPLLGGEVFNLFDWSGTFNGPFSSVTLPALAPHLSWDTSTLDTDGIIRVVGVPTLITTPISLTVYVGDVARFSALADGFGPFTNQWSKDGVDIFGATGTNISITNVTLAHAGTYTFCSSNTFGGNCASATLTVLEVTNIADGLIAWWKLDAFDTGNNRTVDSTTNLQHLSGVGIQSSNVVTGVRSNGFNFNGAASNFVARVHTGGESLPSYQYPAMTLALWVKGSHTAQADKRVYMEASTNNNNPLFGIGTHTTQGGGPQVDIYIRNNNNVTQIDHQRGRLAAFDGNWHHITFVDNSGNISLYVDGQWDTNIFYTRSSLTLNSVALASVLRSTYGAGYIGELDDTMVWRRALNSNEAARVYRNALEGVPVITVQPVAQSVECTSNATFSVTGTSLDTIGYQWYFGATPIAGATSATLVRAGTLANAGNYSVVLTNIAGAVTSSVVALTVSDTIPPVVGVNNLVRYLTGSSVSITAAEVFNLGTSVESCGTVTLLGASPTVFTCVGSYAVTVTAHDGNGNTNTGLATVTVIDPASTNLLAYEPFVCYTDGTLGGQAYRGTGFAAGSWTIDSGDGFATNAASLRYASGYHVLASDGGRAYTPAAGFNTARANVDTSGAFSGLVDGGLVGGPNASGTLYFSFLARNASGDLTGSDDFAGLQLFDGGTEVLGIGNNWGAWAYSLFGISGDVDLTNNSGGFFSMDANTHLFVARIDYASGADDTVTVWMDPDISVGEGSQGNLYRRTFTGNARFNRITLRSGSNNNDNSWDFDELRFGSGWAQVTAAGVAVTTQPASVSVQCGGSTSLSVVTAALVPPVYQWYRNGSAVSLATNATLNLAAVTTATAGSYTVVANNKYGSVTSAVATVTVTNTPSLISPLGPLAVGAESNDCGSMVLAGGSAYRWELNDATGGAGTGWDFLNVTGDINIEATSGNTFAVNLWSLNGVTPGLAANWNNDTTNEFVIAGATGAVNAFAANKFTLNDANFANDLAGGTFAIEEGSLKLKFTPNHAPVATSITNNRAPNLTWKIKIADVLAALTSDVDGDARGLVSLGTSTNGVTVTTNATHILYTNPNNVEDEFTYTVRDVGPAYRAGDTIRTGSATIRLTVNAPTGTNQNAVAISFTNGVVGMRFAGIPGYSYDVQRTTNLTPPVVWTTLHNTNCPPLGLFDYIDLTPPVGQAYYRTAQP